MLLVALTLLAGLLGARSALASRKPADAWHPLPPRAGVGQRRHHL